MGAVVACARLAMRPPSFLCAAARTDPAHATAAIAPVSAPALAPAPVPAPQSDWDDIDDALLAALCDDDGEGKAAPAGVDSAVPASSTAAEGGGEDGAGVEGVRTAAAAADGEVDSAVQPQLDAAVVAALLEDY